MLADVRTRIERACAVASRDPRGVTLVAVTKGRSPDEVRRALLDLGHRVLGENRVQEWRPKAAALGDDVAWHLVGHLQTNKVRYCAPFALIHSLDSERLADALEAEGAKRGHVHRVLVQVNVAGEASKQGVAPAEVPDLVRHVASLDHVRLEGLMTIAPFEPDPERARPVFRGLRDLADRYAEGRTSMGMSGDLEVAIEEGATWVRVGRALFEPAGGPADGGAGWT
ncbi:MAG: YggS family pyridoxal phosphate-dependent enzyme [Trueperaceae bacterium]|nr:YggS family pyridoxal phosphate-dependent enzyme [Trueperaceae bacterium]